MTKDLANISASELLALKDFSPLTSGSEEDAKRVFRALCLLWHPDKNKNSQASEVIAQLVKLYTAWKNRLTPSAARTIHFEMATGKTWTISFFRRHMLAMGTLYYARRTITYVFPKEKRTPIEWMLKHLNEGFPFATADMRDEFARYLPEVVDCGVTKNKETILILRKTPDQFLLQDVMDLAPEQFTPQSVAWIISCMYNLGCYLNYANLSHNDLSPRSLWISPQHHSIAILGGWWASTRYSEKYSVLPRRSADLRDPQERVTTGDLDRRLIKALGRELLGDISGMGLLARARAGEIPLPMVEFLRSPPNPRVRIDYEAWSTRVLPASFGVRKFTPFPFDENLIYKES